MTNHIDPDSLAQSRTQTFARGLVVAYLDAGVLGVTYEIWTPDQLQQLIDYGDEALNNDCPDERGRSWHVGGVTLESYCASTCSYYLNDQPFSAAELRELQTEARRALEALETDTIN